MQTIQNGDAIIKFSGPVGERGSKAIKGSLVIAESTFPCTAHAYHTVVLRSNKPPVCIDRRASNILVLSPDSQNLPLILGGKR